MSVFRRVGSLDDDDDDMYDGEWMREEPLERIAPGNKFVSYRHILTYYH